MVDLRLAGTAGGMFGWGTTPNTQDMIRNAAGPGFGAELGLKLLVIDASVNVFQIVKDGGLNATLIQGLIGTDIDFPAGNTKLENGQSVHMVHTGVVAGFVLGTNAPAMRPVTNDQLAGKGFVTRYRLAYEYFLNPFMGVSVEGHFGYHYLVGGSATVNNSSDHSSGYHIVGLASFIRSGWGRSPSTIFARTLPSDETRRTAGRVSAS
jgi:hypothetical protein